MIGVHILHINKGMITNNQLMQEVLSDFPIEEGWVFRAEYTKEEIDETKNMLAVFHVVAQDEMLTGHKTYKMVCALTGQMMMSSMPLSDFHANVGEIYTRLATQMAGYDYTVKEGCQIIHADCELAEVADDALYYTFDIPFTLIV